MPVYDDERQRGQGFDEIADDDQAMRDITGINEEQESAMDREATSGAAKDILARERQAAKGNVAQQVRPSKEETSVKGGASSGGAAGGASASGTAAGSSEAPNLKAREEEAGLYKGDDEGKGSKKRTLGKLQLPGIASRRRIIVIVLSLIGTLSTTVAGMLAVLSPFKALSIPFFLEDRGFSAMNNLSEKLSEEVFTSYVKRHVIPGLTTNNCASTKVSRHCATVASGNDPISNLYKRWAQGNLEHKLAVQGFEIVNDNGRFFMRAPGLGNGVSLDDVTSGRETNMFNMRQLSRGEVRAQFKQAFQDESFFKKLFYRMRVGNLLKQKYGIVRCYFACDFKDKFTSKVQVKKRAFYALFVRRVLEPRSIAMATVFHCLLQNCSDLRESDPVTSENPSPDGGEPQDEFDRQTRDALRSYASAFTNDKLEKLVKNLDDVKKDGVTKYILKKTLEKFLGAALGDELGAEVASKTVTAIGWVLLIAKILNFISEGGQALKKYAYVVNAATMVSTFYMFRTIADEARSSHVDATMLGSVTDALNGNVDGTAGAPAEASGLYKQTFNSKSTFSTTAFMRALVPQKAYAASFTNPMGTEKCAGDDGKQDGPTLEQSQDKNAGQKNLVCPEMHLVITGSWLVNVSNFLTQTPVLSQIIGIVNTVTSIAGDIINTLTNAVNELLKPILEPVESFIMSLIGGIVTDLVTWFLNLLIPNVLPDGADGARMFDAAFGGADSAGNDSAHRLGGSQALTPQQTAAIRNDQQQSENEAFAALPLKDRIFNTTYEQSFMSQVALNMPSDATGVAESTFANLLANPFGKLMQGFGSLFSLRPAFAATIQVQDDPFDITQYGIPLDNPVFSTDPVDYWNNHCADGKITAAYNTLQDDIEDGDTAADGTPLKQFGYTIDENTKQPINQVANPCMALDQIANYDRTPPNASGSAASTMGSGSRDDANCGGTFTSPVGGAIEPIPPTTGQTINVAAGGDVAGAISQAQPGDNVVLAPGNYSGELNVNKQGSPGKCITIVGDNGMAVFNGAKIDGSQYVRLINITSQNSGSYGISANGITGVTMADVKVDHSANGGINFPGSKNVIVDGCDVGFTNGGPGGNGEGEAISVADETTDSSVRYCKVHDSGEEGIDVKYSNDKTTNVEVYNNEVYNNGGPNIYIDGVNGVKVYNNDVHDSQKDSKSGIMMGCESEWAPSSPSQNIEVYSNNVHHNKSGGITIWDGGCGITNVKVHDNILSQGDTLDLSGGTNVTESNNTINP